MEGWVSYYWHPVGGGLDATQRPTVQSPQRRVILSETSVVLKLKITGLDQSPDFTDDKIGLEVGLKVMLISLAQRPMGDHHTSSSLSRTIQKKELKECVLLCCHRAW